MKLTSEELIKLSFIIFTSYIEEVGISKEEMGRKIKDLHLVDYIEENQEMLNHYGPMGYVKILDRYIKQMELSRKSV